jgi:serine/threonine protein kinase/Tol biopolymer transport system component
MIGETVSHYKILEKLGEGGMGVVYKAEDTKLKRVVALKFLPRGLDVHEPERARFLQEAQAAATLNHPNICTVHDIAEYEGQQFIVMEFVDGKTLRQIIPVQKIQDAITYAIQIGEALQEAHSKGVVHRDVKTDNIMVNSKNQIKVMDFGLAKLKGSLKLTRTSSTVGTLGYMAPEQIQGGEVDARSDIFSFGVVLYEMLTGQLPFRGEHEAAMMYSIVNEEPEPIQRYRPELPSELSHIISRSLEKDPEDRYQTVHDVVIELRRVKKETSRVSRKALTEMPLSSATPTETAQAVEARKTVRISKKKLWLASGLAVVLLAVIVLYFLLSAHPRELNPKMTFRVLTTPLTDIFYPGLSGDGNWAVFPARDEKGKCDVYFMNVSAGEPRRITSDSSAMIARAVISPDGSQIVYNPLDIATGMYELRIVSTTGGVSKRIARPGLIPTWRPDGKRVGYVLGRGSYVPTKTGKLEFWTVNPDGSDNRREFTDTISTTTGRVSFSWSPDGKSIAWIRSFPPGYQEVIVHALETGEEQQLTFDKKTIDEVCWTRNGFILFSSNKGGNTNLWMVPAKGGESVQITKGSGPDIAMQISSDASRLLYLQQQPIGHIWITDLEKESAHQVTFEESNIQTASFSPDGKQIAFTMQPDPIKLESHVYVMNRDGSNRQQLTFGDDDQGSLTCWSPDGKWIAYSSTALRAANPDSAKVYLIDMSNPGTSKYLGRGLALFWLNPNTLIAFTQTSGWLTYTDGSEQKRYFDDSTWALPILSGKYICYQDFRVGKKGLWIVSSDYMKDPSKSTPRKLLTEIKGNLIADPNGEQILYVNDSGEVWRIEFPSGKQVRVRGSLQGLTFFSYPTLSYDGKELVYTDYQARSKLVMIENMFK